MDWTAHGLPATAGLLGFFMAFMNGAANAFASAAGSKAITIEQAVVIAGRMSLTGAVLLGGIDSSTLVTGPAAALITAALYGLARWAFCLNGG